MRFINKKSISKKSLSILAIAGSIALFILIFEYLNFTEPGDRLFSDYMFRNHPAGIENERVVMIGIDEASLAYFADQRTYWPWPREFYAILTQYLSELGAQAIVMDILFDTPDFDRIALNGEVSDRRYVQAMLNSDNTVLGFKTGRFHEDMPSVPVPDAMQNPLQVEGCEMYQPQSITTLPIPKFLESSKSLGNTHIETERDGLIRNLNFISNVNGFGFTPSLSLAAYLLTLDEEINITCTNNSLVINDVIIPLQSDGSYSINWYGRGGTPDGAFTYYSFWRLVRDAVNTQIRENYQPEIDPEHFRDKVVFVGANAAGLADIKNTPVSSLADFPGMEIHATALQNLFDETFLTKTSFLSTATFLLLFAISISLFFGYRAINKSSILAGVLIFSIPVLSGLLFTTFHIIPPVTSSLFVVILCYTGVMSFNYFTEGKEKRMVRSAFNQYVQPEVVQELMNEPEKLKLGGDKKNITILFSDLAGFTSISESLSPEKLISILNIYLDTMSDVILKNRGTIDKYIGDAIMAFWGAPLPEVNSANLACKSALQMSALTPQIIEKIDPSLNLELYTRYGINTGDVVVGNIGSENRFSYTVLGDSVNLAARLEPANKMFGTEIMISEYTKKQLTEPFLMRQLDLMVVKGKTEPVKVFELMADLTDDKDHSTEQEVVKLFNEGLNYYFDQEWEKAINKFESVVKKREGDGPSLVYIKRCKDFLQQPPGENWAGVYEMTTK